MGLAESFEFLVILEDNHFARVATQHDGILESSMIPKRHSST